MYIFAQIVGFIAMGVSFFMYQQGKRKRVIVFKLSADILWVLNFLLIGGYAGAMTTFIAVFREIVFYNRFEEKWANRKIWPYLFAVLYVLSAVLKAENIFDIFPSVTSIISTFALWNTNVKKLKLLSVPASICMLIYNLYCFSIAGIINEILTLTSIFISLVMRDKRGVKK